MILMIRTVSSPVGPTTLIQLCIVAVTVGHLMVTVISLMVLREPCQILVRHVEVDPVSGSRQALQEMGNSTGKDLMQEHMVARP